MAATNKTAPDAPARGALAIRRVPIASLHSDPANARAHDERNLHAITASLQRFGQAEPLIVHGLGEHSKAASREQLKGGQ